jgi:hypothetical protein
VSELVESASGQWNMLLLRELFGPEGAEEIIGTIQPPGPDMDNATDTLVWAGAAKGRYSVKEGYMRLSNQISTKPKPQGVIWVTIWAIKGILPKI